MPFKRKRLSSFQIIILGFAGVILIGGLLLMLPIASAEHCVTPFDQSLFTATSAVCVTGLVVKDTALYWSSFGQAVILLLIQVGGLGVVTVAISFAMLSGRKISLMQRNTMQESVAAQKVGGIVRLTGFIIKGSLLIEALGAISLMPSFCRDHGLRGIWLSVFHAISSFCNAGFDLNGTKEAPFVSMTGYADQPGVLIPMILLIIIGGIGFLTWDDIKTNGVHLRHYRLQSKVILITYAVLILLPFCYFLMADYADLPIGERILNSLFQAVTPRTAGFNSADLTTMSDGGKALTVFLMLIGGAPGSTAGGMKVTTVAVLYAASACAFRRKEDTEMFHRRIEVSTVRNAAAIVVLYFSLFFTGGLVISLYEHLPLVDCLYETASAIGTVGLTLSLTPSLGLLSRFILIGLMFFGRVGGLTLIYAALSGSRPNLSKLPQEKITVG